MKWRTLLFLDLLNHYHVYGLWSNKSYKLSVNDKLKNEPCKVNVNPNEPLHYPFVVSLDKCGRSCNTIDGPYTRVCVSNKLKNINLKELYLMSRFNELRL